jgi:hypothetical protein
MFAVADDSSEYMVEMMPCCNVKQERYIFAALTFIYLAVYTTAVQTRAASIHHSRTRWSILGLGSGPWSLYQPVAIEGTASFHRSKSPGLVSLRHIGSPKKEAIQRLHRNQFQTAADTASECRS